MSKVSRLLGSIAGVAGIALCASSASADTASFDFDNGNAATAIVIPTLVPNSLATLGHGDASLILRVTALLTNGWFDAIAPYHPTAVGVYSNLGRRPSAEHATNRQRNIAILYA